MKALDGWRRTKIDSLSGRQRLKVNRSHASGPHHGQLPNPPTLHSALLSLNRFQVSKCVHNFRENYLNKFNANSIAQL